MSGLPEQNSDLVPWNPRLRAFYFGADYNPEQWMGEPGSPDERIWLEDMRLMQQAHLNVAAVGIFSWSSLQPDERTFVFDWLDRVLDLLHEHGIYACLGTATAALPAWVPDAYPDILPVDAQGVRRAYGQRQNYCPTSPDFRRLAAGLVRRLAERYRDHPALLNWHVSNEYYGGATDQGIPCHCPRCQERFRQWLRERYGSLAALNRAWMTAFWSHTYTAWEQIRTPGPQADHSVQGQVLDFMRFVSAMYLECYLNERDILREITPGIPVTTNVLGVPRYLDLFTWASHLDVMSMDSYPTRKTHPADVAFQYDAMRSLKGGQPFILMEQTPSQTHWKAQNPLKRPGVMRLLSYQALAHGADAIQFFQWRQSRGSVEMFHGAIVNHVGHEHTRVFREVAELGAELQALSYGENCDLLRSRTRARVALLIHWPNWWNVEFLPGPSDQIRYLEEVMLYYRALWKQHIEVDIIAPDADLAAYDLVCAPLLHMVSASAGSAIERYVVEGGTFVTGYFSGVVDECALAWSGGYPGPLRKTLGIWVEEYDPLEPDMSNTVVVPEGSRLAAGRYRCERWCDLLHLEGAQALASFGEDFYAGSPAITEHRLGAGRAFYVATRPEEALIAALVALICKDLQLTSPIEAPEQIEIAWRHGSAASYAFLLNHSDADAEIVLPEAMRDALSGQVYARMLRLPARGVAIVSRAGADMND